MIKGDFSKMHIFDIILVCGLPSSGKSYFARHEFATKERRRISRKEIRRFIYEMTNFGDKWSEQLFSSVEEPLVKHTERKMIEHLLSIGEKVLVDNTSITVDSRKLYTTIASRLNKTIGVIFIDADINRCIMRNRNSKDPIPENILPNLSAKKSLPDKREGFDAVMIVPDSALENQS
jgi:tRNA uridine 5-carbamoylmethylation protein Kti12